MKLSRERQIKAILGRFGGNYEQAQAYCLDIASEYPKLAEEYRGYRNTLEEKCSAST